MSNEAPLTPPPPPGSPAGNTPGDASAPQPPKLKLQPRTEAGKPLPPPAATAAPLPPPPAAATVPKPAIAPTVRPSSLSPTTGTNIDAPESGLIVAVDVVNALCSVGCAVFLALELFTKTKV